MLIQFQLTVNFSRLFGVYLLACTLIINSDSALLAEIPLIDKTALFAHRPPAPFLPEQATDLFGSSNEELILILGDDDYSLRLQAEALLLKIPPDELIALTAKYHALDLEARLRLSRLAQQAKSLKFKQKVQRFTLAVDPMVDKEIPGWLEFVKIFPEGNKFRREYAVMIANDPELFTKWDDLENWENTLATRCFEISTGLDSGMNYQPLKSSTIHSLIFLTSLPDCKGTVNVSNTLFAIVSNHSNRTFRNFTVAENNSVSQDFDTILLSYWVGNSNIIPDYNRFSIGNRYDLPGTLVLSRKMISSISDGTKLHDPICCLARLGDESYISDLVALLKDDRHAGPRTSSSSKGNPFGIQVRDIALACLVSKTNQSLADYGFHNIRDNSKTLFNKYSTNFADEEARTKAFEKWNAWAKININEKGQLIKAPK